MLVESSYMAMIADHCTSTTQIQPPKPKPKFYNKQQQQQQQQQNTTNTNTNNNNYRPNRMLKRKKSPRSSGSSPSSSPPNHSVIYETADKPLFASEIGPTNSSSNSGSSSPETHNSSNGAAKSKSKSKSKSHKSDANSSNGNKDKSTSSSSSSSFVKNRKKHNKNNANNNQQQQQQSGAATTTTQTANGNGGRQQPQQQQQQQQQQTNNESTSVVAGASGGVAVDLQKPTEKKLEDLHLNSSQNSIDSPIGSTTTGSSTNNALEIANGKTSPSSLPMKKKQKGFNDQIADQQQSTSDSTPSSNNIDVQPTNNNNNNNANNIYEQQSVNLIHQQSQSSQSQTPSAPTKNNDPLSFANQDNEFIPLYSNNVQKQSQSQSPSQPSSPNSQQQNHESEPTQLNHLNHKANSYSNQHHLQSFNNNNHRMSNMILNKHNKYYKSNDLYKQLSTMTPPLWLQGYCTSEDLPNLDLEKEIELFYQWLVPTQYENRMRQKIVNDIESIVKQSWPKAKVIVFGSFSTDLCIPSSDIDIQISGINEVQSTNGRYSNPINDLYNTLSKHHQKEFTNIRLIAAAKVPIIKMAHKSTWYNVDICFDTPNGIENTEIVKQFLKKYKSMRIILLILKYFMFQNNMNETYSGGIGSYALALMVVSYIQMRNLPMDQRVHHKRSTYNSENENYKHAGNDTDFGKMILDFFKLYGQQFQYTRHGICLNNNGFYFKKGEQYGIYLTIRDPHDANNDVGKNSFNISFIRGVFFNAMLKMTSDELLKDKYSALKFPTILSRLIEERLVEQQAKDRNNVIKVAKQLEELGKLPQVTSQSPILTSEAQSGQANPITIYSPTNNNTEFVNITSSSEEYTEDSIHSNDSGSDIQSSSDFYCSSAESGSDSESNESGSTNSQDDDSVSNQSSNLYGW